MTDNQQDSVGRTKQLDLVAFAEAVAESPDDPRRAYPRQRWSR